MLLRLAPSFTCGPRLASRSELLQLQIHQAGVADLVAEREGGCYDPKAQDRRVRCRVNLGGDLELATQQAAKHDPVGDKVCECRADGEDEHTHLCKQHR